MDKILTNYDCFTLIEKLVNKGYVVSIAEVDKNVVLLTCISMDTKTLSVRKKSINECLVALHEIMDL